MTAEEAMFILFCLLFLGGVGMVAVWMDMHGM